MENLSRFARFIVFYMLHATDSPTCCMQNLLDVACPIKTAYQDLSPFRMNLPVVNIGPRY